MNIGKEDSDAIEARKRLVVICESISHECQNTTHQTCTKF